MLKQFGLTILLFFFTTALVQATEPTVAPKNLVASNVTCGSATISWTQGDGPYTTVVIKEGSAVDVPPTDGTWPTAFSGFGNSLSNLGGGNYVCYNNLSYTFTVTGLQMGKTYYVCAYTNDGVSSNPDYLTSSYICTSFTTSNVLLDFDTSYFNYDYCQNTNKVTFKNKSSVTYSGAKFIWRMYNNPPGFDQFSMDAGQNGDSLEYTWTKPGVKLVELFLVPANGCSGTARKSLLIYPRTYPKPYVDDSEQCFDFGRSHFFFNENTTMDPTPKSSFQREWFIDKLKFTVPNPDVKGLAAGTYKVMYVGKSLYDSKLTPCFDTAYITIKVIEDPSSGMTVNDDIQCYRGNKFDFDNALPGLVAFNWDFGDMSANQTTKQASHVYSAVGTYTVTHRATSKEGCVSEVKRPVEVKPNVDAGFTGLPANLCEKGDSMELKPVRVDGTFSGPFVWKTYFDPKATGTYNIQRIVPDEFCPDTVIQSVVVNPLPYFNLGTDQVICDGSARLLTISASGTYLWDDGSALATRSIDTGGLFWAQAINKGCIWRDTIDVFDGKIPIVDFHLPDDIILCKGEVLHLHVYSPGSTTRWGNGSTDTSFYVTSPGHYTVTVTNPCGSATDEINVNYAGDNCDLFVPDAFTPNRDGRNEIFQILGRGITPKMFIIYNRWGQCVFDSRKTGTFGWDGTYMQEDCMDGLYSYLFYYEVKSGDRVRRDMHKGSVLLYR